MEKKVRRPLIVLALGGLAVVGFGLAVGTGYASYVYFNGEPGIGKIDNGVAETFPLNVSDLVGFSVEGKDVTLSAKVTSDQLASGTRFGNLTYASISVWQIEGKTSKIVLDSYPLSSLVANPQTLTVDNANSVLSADLNLDPKQAGLSQGGIYLYRPAEVEIKKA